MLQKKFSNNLKIITINIGRENFEIINEFLLELNIDAIEPYKSNTADVSKKIKLRGIPTTLIINKQGIEIARALGSIDFVNKDFINWIDQLI